MFFLATQMFQCIARSSRICGQGRKKIASLQKLCVKAEGGESIQTDFYKTANFRICTVEICRNTIAYQSAKPFSKDLQQSVMTFTKRHLFQFP